MSDYANAQRRISSPKVIAAAEKSARRRSIPSSPSMQLQGAVGSRGYEKKSSSKKKSFSSKDLAIAEARKYYKVEVSRKHVFEVSAG